MSSYSIKTRWVIFRDNTFKAKHTFQIQTPSIIPISNGRNTLALMLN